MSSLSENHRLIEKLDATNVTSFKTDAERIRAKDAAAALLNRLENPTEAVVRQFLISPAVLSSWKVCIDLQLFTKWHGAGPPSIKSTQELANLTASDAALLKRLLRTLAATGFLDDKGNDTYKMTATTVSLCVPPLSSILAFMGDSISPTLDLLPGYLKEQKYQNPTDANVAAWHKTQQLDGKNKYSTVFDYFAEHPDLLHHFQTSMVSFGDFKEPWTNIYPTEELVKTAKSNDIVFVDVGGGMGPDVEKLRAKHPSLPEGSLVLQDRQEVIQKVVLKAPIQSQAHDFFQPQPVKGARAYYMHAILHDWPDEMCIDILRNIAGAMEKGYSTLLLHEVVLLDGTPQALASASDLIMMIMFSARERSEQMFSNMVGKAGLKIKKVWTTPHKFEGIIECEVV